MSPRAVSTFPTSATSIISTCRYIPTITSIASAAPAAQAAPAPRSASWRDRMTRRPSPQIEKLIGQGDSWMSGELPTAPRRGRAPSFRTAAPQPPAAPWRPARKQARQQQPSQHNNRHPQRRPAAPVTRIEDTRPRRAPMAARGQSDEGDASHLPAFLLRPVPLKV